MTDSMKNVTCVVVTYNRLALLKEALAALKAQTHPIRQIIVVDNCSTDGTGAYLATLGGDGQISVVGMESNTGGAGGFAKGLAVAAKGRPDWIWLMDDDTVPRPDALERLMPYTGAGAVGFVCSRVVWTDGSPHMMNQPTAAADQSAAGTLPRPEGGPGPVIVTDASFVSLLVRGSLPLEIGLPYKEFFIWCDDSEYTRRITGRGYIGVLAPGSVALHKTKTNYISSLSVVSAADAWKVYYGERNESFLRRRQKGAARFFFSQLNAFRTHAHRIRKRGLPKDEERALLKASRRGLWDGFTFSPKIDYID